MEMSGHLPQATQQHVMEGSGPQALPAPRHGSFTHVLCLPPTTSESEGLAPPSLVLSICVALTPSTGPSTQQALEAVCG